MKLIRHVPKVLRSLQLLSRSKQAFWVGCLSLAMLPNSIPGPPDTGGVWSETNWLAMVFVSITADGAANGTFSKGVFSVDAFSSGV